MSFFCTFQWHTQPHGTIVSASVWSSFYPLNQTGSACSPFWSYLAYLYSWLTRKIRGNTDHGNQKISKQSALWKQELGFFGQSTLLWKRTQLFFPISFFGKKNFRFCTTNILSIVSNYKRLRRFTGILGLFLLLADTQYKTVTTIMGTRRSVTTQLFEKKELSLLYHKHNIHSIKL